MGKGLSTSHKERHNIELVRPERGSNFLLDPQTKGPENQSRERAHNFSM